MTLLSLFGLFALSKVCRNSVTLTIFEAADNTMMPPWQFSRHRRERLVLCRIQRILSVEVCGESGLKTITVFSPFLRESPVTQPLRQLLQDSNGLVSNRFRIIFGERILAEREKREGPPV